VITGTGSGMSRLARTGLFGGGGAGVGALIGGLTGETSSKKRRNAMIGAVLGGAAGSAVANADKIKEFVSKLMPKKAAEAWQGLTPYEQGFMSKCAELGVDPGDLLKAAGGGGLITRYGGGALGSLGSALRWRVNGVRNAVSTISDGIASSGGIANYMRRGGGRIALEALRSGLGTAVR
jgi:hypothetical protein